MSQVNYAEYTLESCLSFCIMVCAYKIYRMRCDTKAKICDDTIEIELHNQGNKSLEIISTL